MSTDRESPEEPGWKAVASSKASAMPEKRGGAQAASGSWVSFAWARAGAQEFRPFRGEPRFIEKLALLVTSLEALGEFGIDSKATRHGTGNVSNFNISRALRSVSLDRIFWAQILSQAI